MAAQKPSLSSPNVQGFLATPALLLVATFLKLLIASSTTDTLVYSSSWLFGNLWFLLVCLAPVWLLASRAAAVLAFFISLSLALILTIDSMYYRFFLDLPTLDLIGQVDQLGKVQESTFSVMRAIDLIYFLDLPFYLWLARKEIVSPPFRVRIGICISFVMIAAASFFLADKTKTPMQRSVEELRFKNYALAREFSLPVFHAGDLRNYVQRTLKVQNPPKNLAPHLEAVRVAGNSITEDSRYKGIARGSNVLVLLLESWQTFALDAEIDGVPVMPFTRQLQKRTLYFPQIYDQTNLASSADGEFIMANALHPAAFGTTGFRFPQNTYMGLPRFLSEAGYATHYFGYYDGGFYNAQRMVENYGFKENSFGAFGPPAAPEEQVGWSLADYPLVMRVMAILENGTQPFYALVHCSMGHHPFDELGASQKELKLPAELENTILGDYYQMCRFRDSNLAALIKEFEKSPLAQNTILILASDHATALKPDDLKGLIEASGLPPKVAWTKLQAMPQLIKLPSGQSGVFPEPRGQLGFAPTIFHLLGIDPDRPVFLGQNMLTRTPPVFMRKIGAVVDSSTILNVLDRTAYDIAKQQSLRYEDFSDLGGQAENQWRISDDILEYDLVPSLRTTLKSLKTSE